MAVKSPVRASSLNPNAPQFYPASFHNVEDFSPEWWNLIQTSPAFRDYWLRERFSADDEEALLQFAALESEEGAVEELLQEEDLKEFEVDEEIEILEEILSSTSLETVAGDSDYEMEVPIPALPHSENVSRVLADVEKREKSDRLAHRPMRRQLSPGKVVHPGRNMPHGHAHRIQQPRA